MVNLLDPRPEPKVFARGRFAPRGSGVLIRAPDGATPAPYGAVAHPRPVYRANLLAPTKTPLAALVRGPHLWAG
ncbi:hypothetical protein GCM10020216_028880 [Nonomuraea helvata]